MTDLMARCPKCNMKLFRYIHEVDSLTGIGIAIRDGKYKMKCEPCGYRNDDKKPEKYCGKNFTVKVTNLQEVKVFKR